MFYILLCFYLWIYGTLNKISYHINIMIYVERNAKDEGHEKVGPE